MSQVVIGSALNIFQYYVIFCILCPLTYKLVRSKVLFSAWFCFLYLLLLISNFLIYFCIEIGEHNRCDFDSENYCLVMVNFEYVVGYVYPISICVYIPYSS